MNGFQRSVIQDFGKSERRLTVIQFYKHLRLKTIGWNDHQDDIPEAVRDYWNTRNELSAHDGLIYKSNRVVIQKLHLQKISEGVYYISSKTDTYLESNFRLAKHSYKVYELQSRPKTDV